MRLPRFTICRLMVAVALVGLFAGASKECHRRSVRFAKIAETHRAKLPFHCGHEHDSDDSEIEDPRVKEFLRRQSVFEAFHSRMGEKYCWTSRYPWLPVAPDPPEPK